MPDFHAEPYVYLAGLTHKAALIAWGGFYFRVRSRKYETYDCSSEEISNDRERERRPLFRMRVRAEAVRLGYHSNSKQCTAIKIDVRPAFFIAHPVLGVVYHANGNKEKVIYGERRRVVVEEEGRIYSKIE